MKRFYLYPKVILFSLAMIFTIGCKKDKDEEKETPVFEEISIDQEEILDNVPVGLKESTNEYASGLYSYIESCVDMSTFISTMTPPENAQKVNLKTSQVTYKWSISYQDGTLAYYWTYHEDATKDYWDMEIQFNDGPKYPYITAWQLKDGSQGEINFNFNWVYAQYEMEDFDDIYYTYTWKITSAGKYYFDYYVESNDDIADYALHLSLVLNEDGSGTFNYYSADVLFYSYLWDSYGNGSYTYYLMEPPITGTWTVTK